MMDLDMTTTRYHIIPMRKVFKTRVFNRWMRKTLLSDRALLAAVSEMERGLIDADLGGGVVKKRVPLPGKGKSGSTRTIVATKKDGGWFFLFGFEKNERDNITASELETFQKIADGWLAASDADLNRAVIAGKLEEICYGQE